MSPNEPAMKQHVSILGILYIVFGALGVIAALSLLLIFGGAAGIVHMTASSDPDASIAVPILGVLGIVLFFPLAFLSAPGIIVGVGLVKFRSWARIGGLVLSALNLLNFPFGTALAAYGLWVLLSKETEALFT
jgi:hypothetical protein